MSDMKDEQPTEQELARQIRFKCKHGKVWGYLPSTPITFDMKMNPTKYLECECEHGQVNFCPDCPNEIPDTGV